MSATKLDWSTAEVHEGTLVVALDARPAKGWAARSATTARLLNHGHWEKVKVKKGEVRIAPVSEGEEERVRHFLESVVMEANSAIAPDETETTKDPDPPEQGDASDADYAMTERFRAFAQSDSASA
jgi:hypothetical protein